MPVASSSGTSPSLPLITLDLGTGINADLSEGHKEILAVNNSTSHSPDPDPEPAIRRSKRNIHIPAYLENYAPTNNKPIQMSQYASLFQRPISPVNEPSSPPQSSPAAETFVPVPTKIQTAPDAFGVYRIYTEWPSYHPESNCVGVRVGDTPTFNIGSSEVETSLNGLGEENVPFK